MKKSKIIFLTTVIILIKAASIHAQVATFNYVPLKFKNAEPEWIHVICDSTMIGAETDDSNATYDGHTHVYGSNNIEDEYVIHEGFLYVVSRTGFNNDVSGALVEKINISTGELIWKTTYDLRTEEYREHTERIIIRDNKLVLYNYLITEPDSEGFPLPVVFFGWVEGVLKVREYDLETGILIDESMPDPEDIESKKIRDYMSDRTQLHILDDDTFSLFSRKWDTIGSFYIIDTLDGLGRLINDPDTIWSQLDINDWGDSYWNLRWGMKKDSQGLTYWLDYYVPGDFTLDTAQANINIYNNENEIVDIISLGFIDKSNIRTWYLRDVTDDYIYIQVFYFNDESRHFFINKQGELIESVFNPIYRNFYVKLDENQKFIIGDNAKRVGDNFEFSFYQNEDGVLKRLSTLTIDIPNYRSSISHVQRLEDGDYLVAGVYYEVVGFSSKGSTRFIMKLSEEMIMGETVSTSDITELGIDLVLYPNPTSGILHLELEKATDAQVLIYNTQGMEVYSQEFFSDKVDVDLGYLESGVYTVVVSIEGQLVRRKIVRI